MWIVGLPWPPAWIMFLLCVFLPPFLFCFRYFDTFTGPVATWWALPSLYSFYNCFSGSFPRAILAAATRWHEHRSYRRIFDARGHIDRSARRGYLLFAASTLLTASLSVTLLSFMAWGVRLVASVMVSGPRHRGITLSMSQRAQRNK